jgi:hypothetical protein
MLPMFWHISRTRNQSRPWLFSRRFAAAVTGCAHCSKRQVPREPFDQAGEAEDIAVLID